MEDKKIKVNNSSDKIILSPTKKNKSKIKTVKINYHFKVSDWLLHRKYSQTNMISFISLHGFIYLLF